MLEAKQKVALRKKTTWKALAWERNQIAKQASLTLCYEPINRFPHIQKYYFYRTFIYCFLGILFFL